MAEETGTQTAALEQPTGGLTDGNTVTQTEGDGAAQATEASVQPSGTAAPEGGESEALLNGLEGLTGAGQSSEKDGEGDESDDVTKDNEEPAQKYEFKLPEGFSLDSELVDSAVPILEKYKVAPEDAQTLSDLLCKKVQQEHDAYLESCKGLVADWKKNLLADSDIGGAKVKENLAVGLKALNRFGSPELVSILKDTGMEYHPEVVRFFVKVGRAISEDGISSRSDGVRETDPAKMIYPGWN